MRPEAGEEEAGEEEAEETGDKAVAGGKEAGDGPPAKEQSHGRQASASCEGVAR